MNNSEYLAWMGKEYERSRRWRHNDTNNYDKAWKRYSDLYAGRHYDYKNKVDQLTVNLVFATINVMGPAVAINNPKFNVNARRPEHSPQATITEEVLNYYWRTYGYQREFRLAINDWLIMGHGWLKVGYKWVKPIEVKTADDENVGLNNDAGTGDDQGVDDREDVPGNVETEMHTDVDRPFLERISPFDVFVDPDARHPKEMRWIAQRTWRAVADVQVDSRYSPTARKRVTGSSWSRWSDETGDARHDEDKPDSRKTRYAEIIEFYDIKKGKVATFCVEATDTNSGSQAFLIKPEEMPYAFGHPFVMLRNYEVPDTFYPMGDVQQIESLQLELNETRNQMLNYRKKFRRAWLYARDLFDREGVQALESDDDNVMIPVQGDQNPASAIAPVPPSITPPEFFDQSAMISNDIDRISGVSDYQRGAQQSIKRTATEAAMIQDAANARAQDRLQRVEHILSETGERVVKLMQQYVTEEQVGRIVTMPVKAWFKFDSDRIQGEFDYEVVGGSTEPQNESFRRQSAMQLVDASVPFMQEGIVNMPALYMKMLRDGFGFKDAERFIQQPPPPPEMAPEGGMMPPPGPEQMGGAPPMPQELTPDMIAQMQMEQQGMAPPPMDPMMDPMMDPSMMQPTPEQIPPELLQQLLQGGTPIS